ncbi:short chain dehydrogenase [Seiridium cupressi]
MNVSVFTKPPWNEFLVRSQHQDRNLRLQDPQIKMADETALQDFPSLFSLKGKVVVVTGGSRGLGLNAASAFLQAGAAQVFITSRKAKACDSAVAQLNALPNLAPGAKAISVPADSANISGIESLVSQVKKHTDHVDILFANAGATWGEAFDTHPDEAFAKVMDLNVKAVFNTIRLFAPLLQKRAHIEDPSRVLITASVAGLGVGTLGKQGTYGYSASKAAVLHLGRNLAVELGPRHITVNSICPGFFPTKMSSGLLDLTGGLEKHAQGNPMRRLGRPEDIAGVVVYLTSRAGSHVNGAAIEIDGGSLWARGGLLAAEEEEKAKL